jgi:hypothetical protein
MDRITGSYSGAGKDSENGKNQKVIINRVRCPLHIRWLRIQFLKLRGVVHNMTVYRELVFFFASERERGALSYGGEPEDQDAYCLRHGAC